MCLCHETNIFEHWLIEIYSDEDADMRHPIGRRIFHTQSEADCYMIHPDNESFFMVCLKEDCTPYTCPQIWELGNPEDSWSEDVLTV